MKEYTIYINKSLPDGGFDVCLNKTLTECDIVVYSIPFRESLTITNNGVAIKQLLRDLLAYKVICPEAADIAISSDIAELLRNSFVTLESSVEINSTVSSSAKKMFAINCEKIEIDQMVEFITNSMTEVNSSIRIEINPISFNLNKYFDTSIQFAICNNVERLSSTKRFSTLSALCIESSASIYYWLLVEPDPLEISVSGSVDLSSVKYRLLEEIDVYSIDKINNTSLEDLDIVVLD